MSVLAIIRNEHDAQGILPWAARFALAEDTKLRVALFEPGTGTASWERVSVHSDDETSTHERHKNESGLVRATRSIVADNRVRLSAIFEGTENSSEIAHAMMPKIMYAKGKDLTAAVVDLVEEESPTTVVIGWRDKTRDAEVGRIVDRLPCQVMAMRAATLQENHHAPRVLVPVAGGPHAFSALKLAARMASEGHAQATALYISRDVEMPDAQAVAKVHLRKMLEKIPPDLRQFIDAQALAEKNVRKTIEEAAQGHDLLLVGASDANAISRSLFGTIADHVFGQDNGVSLAVVRRADPLSTRFQRYISEFIGARLPQLDREERVQLFDRLHSGSACSRDYILMMALSTTIAALGLMQNSTAVVVGAMLVAPLMTPIIGAGLGLVQGNVLLVKTAARSITIGFLVALGIGYTLGLMNPGLELTTEIMARGGPNPLDLMVALASGLAAAYALTRPQLSAALPGVAIAAALVPPVASIGLALSLNEIRVARGATLLFAVNVVMIILSSAAVLSAVGVRAAADQASKIWVRRVLMILILSVGLLMIPLTGAFIAQLQKQDVFEEREWTVAQREHIETVLAGRADLANEKLAADGVWDVRVHLVAREFPQPEQMQAAAVLESKRLGAPVRLKVETVLQAEQTAMMDAKAVIEKVQQENKPSISE